MEHAPIEIADLQKIRTQAAQLVAAIDDAIARSTNGKGVPVVIVSSNGSIWRKPDVADCVRRVYHLPAARALLELCAASPGEWVTYEAVHANAGHSNPRQTQNELSAMSAHIKKARGTNSWPVDVDATAALQYKADPRMAKWITHALAAVTDDDA